MNYQQLKCLIVRLQWTAQPSPEEETDAEAIKGPWRQEHWEQIFLSLSCVPRVEDKAGHVVPALRFRVRVGRWRKGLAVLSLWLPSPGLRLLLLGFTVFQQREGGKGTLGPAALSGRCPHVCIESCLLTSTGQSQLLNWECILWPWNCVPGWKWDVGKYYSKEKYFSRELRMRWLGLTRMQMCSLSVLIYSFKILLLF